MRWSLAFLIAVALCGCRTPYPSVSAAEAEIGPVGTDFHMHAYRDATPVIDHNRLLMALDGAGIRRGVVLSRAYAVDDEAAATRLNDWTLAEAAASERLLPFCGVPITPEWSPTELRRCAQAGGLGVKLHAVNNATSLNNAASIPSLDRIASIASEFSLPILIHIDHASRAEVTGFFEWALRHPTVEFVAAHTLAASLPMLLEAPPNVSVEISGVPLAPPEAYPAFVAVWRQFGIERVLFGSDFPILHPADYRPVLDSMGFTDEEQSLVLGGNARRLLGF